MEGAQKEERSMFLDAGMMVGGNPVRQARQPQSG